MCTVLQPPGVNPIAVNKYIISNEIQKVNTQKCWANICPHHEEKLI